MSSRIAKEWLRDPPRTIVIGDGSYATALALVLGAVSILPNDLVPELSEPEDGRFPQVLASLERVVVVAGAGTAAADLLRWHEAIWRWIETLSPNSEQQEVAILFVLPYAASSSLADVLAIGLGLEKIDPATSGHGIAGMGDSLETLCTALAAIHPLDLPPLRARMAADTRHRALHLLRNAKTPEDLAAAAKGVTEYFQGNEYHLDLFCRLPSHRNGNQLRQWLSEAVTRGVTPEMLQATRMNLATWLRPE